MFSRQEIKKTRDRTTGLKTSCLETLVTAPICFLNAGVFGPQLNAKVLRGYLEPSWHNKEKKYVKKKVIVNKSHSLAAMFVSENGINISNGVKSIQ